MKVQKFIEFPKAHPYFPESLLSSVEKEASELLRTDSSRARALIEKVNLSQTYYDLVAILKHGARPDKAHLDELDKGFMSRNSRVYASKVEGRQGYFDDPDSRWFGMSRAVARDIVLDEILADKDTGFARIPSPKLGALAAESDVYSVWEISIGLICAVALGYGVHRITSQSTNPQ